jgi:hypothetical protein
MPRLADLQTRVFPWESPRPTFGEESLVDDLRGGLSPAEMVDLKVYALLGRCSCATAPVPHPARERRSATKRLSK